MSEGFWLSHECAGGVHWCHRSACECSCHRDADERRVARWARESGRTTILVVLPREWCRDMAFVAICVIVFWGLVGLASGC